MKEYISPPRWSLRFFRWYCRPEFVEDIEGDLIERYQDYVIRDGVRKAKWLWYLEILKLLRFNIIRQPEFLKLKISQPMFRHNFKLAWRSARKDKSTFFINLLGLTAGVSCALLIFLWVQDERSIDQFHTHGENLYQVLENVDQGNGIITRQTNCGPMAEALEADFPEIEKTVIATTNWSGMHTLTLKEENIDAQGVYASEGYFDVFTYPLILGDASALQDPTGIFLSKSLASRIFGDYESAMGESLTWQHRQDFNVLGIFEDMPSNSSVQFDFVLPWSFFLTENEWITSWGNTAIQTYVLLNPEADFNVVNDKITHFVEEKTEGNITHRRQFLAKYTDLYLHGEYTEGILTGGRIEYVRLFSLIAAFILIIACINFMNLSTAKASGRFKEVAVKKTIGANRKALIFQYLTESFMIVAFAVLLSLLISYFLLPSFNQITGKSLTMSFSSELLIGLFVILLGVSLLAGSYPALYLSGFRPVDIMRGRFQRMFGETWIRKGLVVFQFSTAVILIVIVTVIYQQIKFVQNQHLGYDRDLVILFSRDGVLDEDDRLETFLNHVRSMPGVKSASASEHDMTGHNGGTYGLRWPGKDPGDRTEFERVAVDYGFIEMLDLDMASGRSFSRDISTENEKIIFNEAGIRFMGLEDPIGQTIQLWGEPKEIVGVVKDFHFDSFHEEIKPLFLRLDVGSTNYIMLKLAQDQERNALDELTEYYAEFNPGFTFNYRFLDDDYQSLYEAEQKVETLSKYFAGLALLICCLGLFGLAAFTAQRRFKEIGIRKILGSSEFGVVTLLSKEFNALVLIALLIALPISYLLVSSWLSNFAFHMDLKWWHFALSGVLVFIIALITISTQTFKAARINPVKSLQSTD